MNTPTNNLEKRVDSVFERDRQELKNKKATTRYLILAGCCGISMGFIHAMYGKGIQLSASAILYLFFLYKAYGFNLGENLIEQAARKENLPLMLLVLSTPFISISIYHLLT